MPRMRRKGQVDTYWGGTNTLEGCFFPGFGQDDGICPDWKPLPPGPDQSDESGGPPIIRPPYPEWPSFEGTLWPLCAVVWYATQLQDEFGHVRKTWRADHILQCNVNQTTNYKDQQVVPDQILIVEDMLALQTLDDVRIAKQEPYAGQMYSLTDILISGLGYPENGTHGEVGKGPAANEYGINPVYYESGGTRQGLSTLYEISGVLPHNGFEGNDYFKVVISRSMHQELLD